MITKYLTYKLSTINMFPDFPNIKNEIKKNFEEYLRRQSISDPLIASITQIFIHEGDRLVFYTVDGDRKETSFNEIQSKFSIPDEKLINEGPKALVSVANEVGGDMQKQLGRNIITKLEEVTKETGNVIDCKGAQISPDFILQALEKMQIDFDDEGNPCMPTMFVGQDLAKKIQDKLPEWEKDKEHKKKFEELMKKKKEEWNDRESNRKLVD